MVNWLVLLARFPQINLKVYFVILSLQENVSEKLTKITNRRPWEGWGLSEIAACGKGQGLCPPSRFVSYGCALNMTLGRRRGDKPFKFDICLSPLWSVDKLTCPFTRSLLPQLRSLTQRPWDNIEAAQRPCLSDELSKIGEDWPTALEHSLSPVLCLDIHLLMNINLDRQPPPITVLPLKMSHESLTAWNSSEWQFSLDSMGFCDSWTLCPRGYPSSIFKFPTIHVDWSLTFGPCPKHISRNSGSSFLFRGPAETEYLMYQENRKSPK